MDDRGRRPTLRRRSFQQLVVLLAAWACVSGCVGPKAVRYTRMRYNEVIRDTNDEQLLINIVRLRYADSPSSSTCPTSPASSKWPAGATTWGATATRLHGRASLGYGELSLRDTPTLSYHPREGREIAKALLTPLSADLFIVVNAGANLEQLLLLSINDINDVPNAPGATILIPQVADDNSLYIRGIRLLASLRARDATELAFGTDERDRGLLRPNPQGRGPGARPPERRQDGYVYRTQGEGQVTLLKREKGLYLRIRPPYVHSPEMAEVARIFRLTPGLSKYRIKSELTEEANQSLPSPIGADTIYLNLRSVLQIMTFLSKGVCVPEEHVRSGVAPVTPGPDGRPFDWTQVTAGNFFVHVAETPAPRCGGGRAVPGLLVLHRPERRELAGGLGHPRNRVRTARIGRPERRPAAHPPARQVR